MNRLDVLTLSRDPLPPLHPVLLRDGSEMALIDCGCSGMLPLVRSAMAEAGADLARLTRVIITHHDHDHMGALAALQREAPAARAYCSEVERPYIEGRAKSLRMAQEEAALPGLPADKKAEALARLKMLAAVEPARIDAALADGEVLPCCGGIEAIATPGHMPGHLSLYARAHRTLIAGDALVAAGGRLLGPNPQYTLDLPRALESLRRLQGCDIERVVCFHGGEVAGDIAGALRAILGG